MIICSEEQTVFSERSSRKTVIFEEQIISVPGQISEHSFPLKEETIVFINLQFFFRNTHGLGNITRIFPSFSWGIYTQVTRFYQLLDSLGGQVLFTSEQPKKNQAKLLPISNKVTLKQLKLIFGSLVIQLVWYILKQLFTSESPLTVSVK